MNASSLISSGLPRIRRDAEHECCSFSNALAVPRLAEACIEVLTPAGAEGTPEGASAFGSGIKLLRLVSKGAREVIQRSIKGIVVQIGWEPAHCAASLVGFLQPVSLRWLSLVLADDFADSQAITKNWHDTSDFIPQILPALSSVTELKIMAAPRYMRLASRVLVVFAAVVLLLFFVCVFPGLFWQGLSLVIRKELVMVSGLLYALLLSVHATLGALTPNSRRQLLLKFPVLARVSTFTFSTAPKLPLLQRGTVSGTVMESAACTALRACPRLQKLQLWCAMSAEVWGTLPDSLAYFYTYGICSSVPRLHSLPPPVWPQHSNLTILGILRDSISLREVSILLAAAPSVNSLVLLKNVVNVTTSLLAHNPADYLISELCLVNSRMKSGLVITTRDDKGATIPSIIRLIFHLESNPASSILTASMQSLLAIPVVEFRCHNLRIDMSNLTRVFAGLHGLNLTETPLDEAGLLLLGSCRSLRVVQFVACRGLTCAGASALCAASSSLREMLCARCKDMIAEDGEGMGRVGWGGSVQVVVRNGGPDGKWNN